MDKKINISQEEINQLFLQKLNPLRISIQLQFKAAMKIKTLFLQQLLKLQKTGISYTFLAFVQ